MNNEYQVSGWRSGSEDKYYQQYGLRFMASDVFYTLQSRCEQKFNNENVNFIPLTIKIPYNAGAKICNFKITKGFINKCHEIRDGGSGIYKGTTYIKDLFKEMGLIPWKKGNPPRFKLIEKAEFEFELII